MHRPKETYHKRLSFYNSTGDIGWSEVGHYSTDRRVLSPRVARSGGGGAWTLEPHGPYILRAHAALMLLVVSASRRSSLCGKRWSTGEADNCDVKVSAREQQSGAAGVSLAVWYINPIKSRQTRWTRPWDLSEVGSDMCKWHRAVVNADEVIHRCNTVHYLSHHYRTFALYARKIDKFIHVSTFSAWRFLSITQRLEILLTFFNFKFNILNNTYENATFSAKCFYIR